MTRPTPNNNRRNSFQPPIITLGAALYSAYQTRKEKHASGSAQEIGRSGGKYSPVPFESRSEREREAVATMEGFGLERKDVRREMEGDGDAPPPDYEDAVRGGEGVVGAAVERKKGERDGGGYSFDLRDADEEGRGFLAEGEDDGYEAVGGGGRAGSEGVKMGFFERVRARKEAKRRAWMEKRGGGAGRGFGCRGGRRGRCM